MMFLLIWLFQWKLILIFHSGIFWVVSDFADNVIFNINQYTAIGTFCWAMLYVVVWYVNILKGLLKTWKVSCKLREINVIHQSKNQKSKNQLYKLKNQINKVPTIIKQDDIEFFPNISACHFTNVCNLLSSDHNCRIVSCRY